MLLFLRIKRVNLLFRGRSANADRGSREFLELYREECLCVCSCACACTHTNTHKIYIGEGIEQPSTLLQGEYNQKQMGSRGTKWYLMISCLGMVVK